MRKALRSQGGFTMIELVIVIILLGIVAATILPKMDLSGTTTPLAADIVASDITYTQSAALSKNTRTCINLTTGLSTYLYAADSAAGVCDPLGTSGTSRDLTELKSGVSISAGQTITFNSLGEPMGLTAAVTIIVTDGTTPKSITIQPYTGKVTIL